MVKDVAVRGKHFPHSSIQGFDGEHDIGGVKIENLCVGGRVVTTAEEGRFRIGQHVSDVEFFVSERTQ